jgi:hypothetical protein
MRNHIEDLKKKKKKKLNSGILACMPWHSFRFLPLVYSLLCALMQERECGCMGCSGRVEVRECGVWVGCSGERGDCVREEREDCMREERDIKIFLVFFFFLNGK